MAYANQHWLSTGEVAAQLKVSREWIRLLIQRGDLRAERTRIGFLVDPHSVERYAARHGADGAQQTSREAMLDRLAYIRASITGGQELADDSTELLRQAREGRFQDLD
ncbi:MAG: helix-turn-helix domain-containing protein [Thermomicrobia bacterium]|nr:helix-turn-helix domain-containing protein [Thermomicrobia bacterium]MCA1725011.1 helix-turn-helix domain-containing protein [Thermomicrobia bacterium]